MSTVQTIDDTSFQTAVLESAQPVLVDFYTEWCPPCRQLAPVLDELAGAYGGRLKIAKVDVGESEHLGERHGIASAPTLVIFKGGQEVDRKSGAPSKPVLSDWLDDYVD